MLLQAPHLESGRERAGAETGVPGRGGLRAHRVRHRDAELRDPPRRVQRERGDPPHRRGGDGPGGPAEDLPPLHVAELPESPHHPREGAQAKVGQGRLPQGAPRPAEPEELHPRPPAEPGAHLRRDIPVRGDGPVRSAPHRGPEPRPHGEVLRGPLGHDAEMALRQPPLLHAQQRHKVLGHRERAGTGHDPGLVPAAGLGDEEERAADGGDRDGDLLGVRGGVWEGLEAAEGPRSGAADRELERDQIAPGGFQRCAGDA
mmetsp:Transcript_4988/g.11998  ORF Transcript_4988/g.11998 Transcript_4988/m.11998 type:complete len:259 (-) Transcript_4988:2772-3548(-)